MKNIGQKDSIRPTQRKIDELLNTELTDSPDKIIVLDDDPTGTQTVHDVPVYTDWSKQTIEQVFTDSSKLVYILTNSRSFSEVRSRDVHQDIAQRIGTVSLSSHKTFLLISRGDSTLRGHYPLETEELRKTLETEMAIHFDGEILCPAFFEGGRVTIHDTHYLQKAGHLIPVSETEFAKDQTFGFHSSNLREYIQEKSKGAYLAADCLSLPNEWLAKPEIDKVQELLETSHDFQKIIVNVTNYSELKVFVIGLLRSIKAGKNFLFRTAASFPKVLGGISDKPFLTKDKIVDSNNSAGGLTVVGSHVKLSTEQLTCLKESSLSLHFVEFRLDVYQKHHSFHQEINRVLKEVETQLNQGTSVVVYTSRNPVTIPTKDKEAALAASVNISSALTKIVRELRIKPKYVIAKGGITSSDIATKGLGIHRGMVLGQVSSGIPVWQTDEQSKFAMMPYLIFPGNVGNRTTLYKIIEELERK